MIVAPYFKMVNLVVESLVSVKMTLSSNSSTGIIEEVDLLVSVGKKRKAF